MLTWPEFEERQPVYAQIGRAFLYEFQVGLGFLGTTRPDGGPRVHPICPLLAPEGLFGFIVPGPKLADLRRDGRYALHSETFPPPRHDDAFYVTGRIREVVDVDLRGRLKAQFVGERGGHEWPGFDDQALVEFLVETCLITLTAPGFDLPAGHSVWRVS